MAAKPYRGYPSMTAFILAWLNDGMTIDEIAMIMDREPGEVKTLLRLHRINAAKRAARLASGIITIPHNSALKVCTEAQQLGLAPTALARILIEAAINTGQAKALVAAHRSLM